MSSITNTNESGDSEMTNEAAKKIDPKKCRFPVWATQGGGLVREGPDGTMTFIETPDCPGLEVGDTMPEEWGIIPANNLARNAA